VGPDRQFFVLSESLKGLVRATGNPGVGARRRGVHLRLNNRVQREVQRADKLSG
jgi:hypothetical protein